MNTPTPLPTPAAVFATGRTVYARASIVHRQNAEGIVAVCVTENGQFAQGILLHDGQPVPQWPDHEPVFYPPFYN